MEVVQVALLPTRVWVESGLCGERVVVVQHEGFRPFDYAVFNYDYAYTSNSGTQRAAEQLALQLGATSPVEERHRALKVLTAEQLRKQIRLLTQELARVEAASGHPPAIPPASDSPL